MKIFISSRGRPRYIVTIDGEEIIKTLSLSEIIKFISEEYPEDLVSHVQNVAKIIIEGADQETQQKFERLLRAAFTRENSFYAESLWEEW